MTFSILARDPKTGRLGVATATGKLAVGALSAEGRLVETVGGGSYA